jgi:uncharacterized protein (PEP-CTERM system associated)
MATTRTPTNPRIRRVCRGYQRFLAFPRSKRARVAHSLEGDTLVWLCVAGVLVASGASAQTWRVTPSVAIEETLTNNVNLVDSAGATSDFVSQITPGVSIVEKGARTSLTGTVSVPMLFYARTGSDNNTVYPTVGLFGRVEAIERLFFIEGSVNVSQQYLTPFASRPSGLESTTSNRYTAAAYRISPYFKGVTPGDINYELRDSSTWTRAYQTQSSTSQSYSNEALASVSRNPTPWGWSAEYNRASIKFPDQAALVTQLERARLIRQIDPQLQIFGGAGYENNHYVFADYRDVTYQFGVRWRPTERTLVDADWEHRFFGSSYHLTFDHRMPLSVWTVRASRDVTSYPQQLAGLPAGVDIASYLNQLFLTSIPDPTQRAALIAQLIQNGGLPLFLSGGINLFTQQAIVQQSASASFGLLGARNSVFFTAYRLRSEPVQGASEPASGALGALDSNSQTGGGIAWAYKVTPSLSLDTTADVLRTVAIPPQVGKTTQNIVRTTLTSPVAPNTTAYVGARYQHLKSDVATNYNEVAILVGVVHIFH